MSTDYKAILAEIQATKDATIPNSGVDPISVISPLVFEYLMDTALELLVMVEGEASDADRYCKECVALEAERARLREGINALQRQTIEITGPDEFYFQPSPTGCVVEWHDVKLLLEDSPNAPQLK